MLFLERAHIEHFPHTHIFHTPKWTLNDRFVLSFLWFSIRDRNRHCDFHLSTNFIDSKFLATSLFKNFFFVEKKKLVAQFKLKFVFFFSFLFFLLFEKSLGAQKWDDNNNISIFIKFKTSRSSSLFLFWTDYAIKTVVMSRTLFHHHQNYKNFFFFRKILKKNQLLSNVRNFGELYFKFHIHSKNFLSNFHSNELKSQWKYLSTEIEQKITNSPRTEQKWNKCFDSTIGMFVPTVKGWLIQLDDDRSTIVVCELPKIKTKMLKEKENEMATMGAHTQTHDVFFFGKLTDWLTDWLAGSRNSSHFSYSHARYFNRCVQEFHLFFLSI